MVNKVDRALAICGVLFVIALLVAFVGLGGSTPDSNDSAAKVTSFYAAHKDKQQAGALVLGFAAIFFALFVAAIYQAVRHPDGRNGLSYAVLVGGAVTATGLLLMATVHFSLADAAKHFDATSMRVFNHIDSDTWMPAFGGYTVFLLASAGSALKAALMPRWLGIVGVALAVLSFTPIGFFAFLVSLIWILIASVTLAMRGRRPAAAPPSPREPQPA
jgi:hypothetical protein